MVKVLSFIVISAAFSGLPLTVASAQDSLDQFGFSCPKAPTKITLRQHKKAFLDYVHMAQMLPDVADRVSGLENANISTPVRVVWDKERQKNLNNGIHQSSSDLSKYTVDAGVVRSKVCLFAVRVKFEVEGIDPTTKQKTTKKVLHPMLVPALPTINYQT